MRGSGFDMLIKGISLFLVFMVVLAIFGKLRYPGETYIKSKKCPKCGRFLIGKGPCACSKG